MHPISNLTYFRNTFVNETDLDWRQAPHNLLEAIANEVVERLDVGGHQSLECFRHLSTGNLTLEHAEWVVKSHT